MSHCVMCGQVFDNIGNDSSAIPSVHLPISDLNNFGIEDDCQGDELRNPPVTDEELWTRSGVVWQLCRVLGLDLSDFDSQTPAVEDAKEKQLNEFLCGQCLTLFEEARGFEECLKEALLRLRERRRFIGTRDHCTVSEEKPKKSAPHDWIGLGFPCPDGQPEDDALGAFRNELFVVEASEGRPSQQTVGSSSPVKQHRSQVAANEGGSAVSENLFESPAIPERKLRKFCAKILRNVGIQKGDDGDAVEEEDSVSCSVCFASFVRSKNVRKHLTLHNGPVLRCPKCDKPFASEDEYHIHLIRCAFNVSADEWKSGSERVSCPLCGKAINSLRAFKGHLLRSHLGRMHSCKSCSKKFAMRNELLRHMAAAHTAETCVDSISSAENAKKCSTTLVTVIGTSEKLTLLRKQRSNVRRARNASKTHVTSETAFECSPCQKRFKSGRLLKEHVNIYHENEHLWRICEECGERGYFGNGNLDHYKRCSVANGSAVLICTTCDKVFETPAKLKSHVSLCKTPKRFPCEICGKVFKFKCRLVAHKTCHAEGTGRPLLDDEEKTAGARNEIEFPQQKMEDSAEQNLNDGGESLDLLSSLNLPNTGDGELPVGDVLFSLYRRRSRLRFSIGRLPGVILDDDVNGATCETPRPRRSQPGRAARRLTFYRRCSVANGSAVLICTTCDKVFETPAKLKSHVSLCKTPKRFPCEICGKVFKFKCRLVAHKTCHAEGTGRPLLDDEEKTAGARNEIEFPQQKMEDSAEQNLNDGGESLDLLSSLNLPNTGDGELPVGDVLFNIGKTAPNPSRSQQTGLIKTYYYTYHVVRFVALGQQALGQLDARLTDSIVAVLDALATELVSELGQHAADATHAAKRVTMMPKDVDAAVDVVFSGRVATRIHDAIGHVAQSVAESYCRQRGAISRKSAMLKMRRRFWPRVAIDWASCAFVVSISIITYVFEVFFVLPALGVSHNVPTVLGMFVLLNILGNLGCLMATDTSCSSDLIGVPDVMQAQRENWRLCYDCGALAPPRAWHCNVCKTCILKREHHCMFAGYCVGHRNHRFFMLFLAYIWVGSLYSLFYHSQYLYSFFQLSHIFDLMRFFTPLMFLFFGFSEVPVALSCFIFSINLGGFLFVTAMLVFHLRLIFVNRTSHEDAHGEVEYHLGSGFKNMKEVFGVRWFLTWIFPFVPSALPSDGTKWDILSRDPEVVYKNQ
ncbi:unnamed protein product [Notodromas monacha]|uniref:C2H2-type domain-containing protein n=1 Tax=Notodromas monacha TaxID=399045 RepID=A0A7R9BUL2_9CRUS|nr:unnamed protein product [Notodromas monacha]CAG0920417.1 unnamed protein product [Notodromas monacha]